MEIPIRGIISFNLRLQNVATNLKLENHIMTNITKFIGTFIALSILVPSVAQAHHNVRECRTEIIKRYNCGDDVYRPNSTSDKCWRKTNVRLKQCAKFHREYLIKREEYKPRKLSR